MFPDITNLMSDKYKQAIKSEGGIFRIILSTIKEILAEPTHDYLHCKTKYKDSKWD
jgi:hypothetical protein